MPMQPRSVTRSGASLRQSCLPRSKWADHAVGRCEPSWARSYTCTGQAEPSDTSPRVPALDERSSLVSALGPRWRFRAPRSCADHGRSRAHGTGGKSNRCRHRRPGCTIRRHRRFRDTRLRPGSSRSRTQASRHDRYGRTRARGRHLACEFARQLRRCGAVACFAPTVPFLARSFADRAFAGGRVGQATCVKVAIVGPRRVEGLCRAAPAMSRRANLRLARAVLQAYPRP